MATTRRAVARHHAGGRFRAEEAERFAFGCGVLAVETEIIGVRKLVQGKQED
jgi:hypothetical protein